MSAEVEDYVRGPGSRLKGPAQRLIACLMGALRLTGPGTLGEAPLRVEPRKVPAWIWLGGRGSSAVRLGGWGAAVATALLAQYLLTPLGRLHEGMFFFLAASLIFVATTHPNPQNSSGIPPAPQPGRSALPHPWPLRAWKWSLGGTLVGSSLVMFAAFQVVTKQFDSAIVAWTVGIVVTLLGFTLGALHPPKVSFPTRGQFREVVAVIAILAVAVALRLPDLASVPPDVHGDEAAMGIEARKVLAGQMPNLFGMGWNGFPSLSFWAIAGFMAVFGDNLYGLRMASLFLGVASVGLAYLVMKKLFSARVGFVSAVVLATSHWNIHYGRDGLNNIQAQFASLLLFYFVLRGLETRRAVDFLLAGFAAGLCLNVYFAARLSLLLIGLYVLHRSLTDRHFLPSYWRYFALTAFGSVIFVAPMAAFHAFDLKSLLMRTDVVSVFSPQVLRHEMAAYDVSSLADVLGVQARNALLAFNWRGDTSLQHGYHGPLLEYWSGALLVLGVALALVRWRRSSYFFLAAWTWVTLVVGGIFTSDALFDPRMITLIPALCAAPALVLEEGWHAAERLSPRFGTIAAVIVTGVFLTLSTVSNASSYFHVYVSTMRPADFFTALSRYVETVNDRYRVYLMGRPDAVFTYDTPRFLVPHVDGVEVRSDSLAVPLARALLPPRKGIAFVLQQGAENSDSRLSELRNAYPDGVYSKHHDTRGVLQFHSYTVEPESLLSAAPTAPDSSSGGSLLHEHLRSFVGGTEGFRAPRDVAVATDGKIYVADGERREVAILNPDGSVAGSLQDSFEQPSAVAVLPGGSVAVLDAMGEYPLHFFDSGGNLLSRVGRDLGMYRPRGLWVDPSGSLYIADTGQRRVLKLTADGQRIREYRADGQLGQPVSAATSGDAVLVCDAEKHRIWVLEDEDRVKTSWAISPSSTIDGPHLDIGPNGEVLVTDPPAGLVRAFDPEGRSLGQIGVPGTGSGQFSLPTGIKFDKLGRLFVADTANRRVQEWAPR